MKIVVDKLPNKPQYCPYSRLTENIKGYYWYSCSKGLIACEVDEKGCPFYIDIKTAMKKMMGEDE